MSATPNRIRARLLPVLESVFRHSATLFPQRRRHAAQASELLLEIAQQDLEAVGLPPRIAALQALSRARQANLLRHWLRQAPDHACCGAAR